MKLHPNAPESRRPAGCARSSGFTLLELLIVITIMAMATAGVSMAMRDTGQTALEREAQRLAVLFESARAQSRASGMPVYWHTTESGFQFEGLENAPLPAAWLGSGITARTRGTQQALVRLGPEPIIGPQTVELIALSPSTGQPERSMLVATDGLRPFTVQAASLP